MAELFTLVRYNAAGVGTTLCGFLCTLTPDMKTFRCKCDSKQSHVLKLKMHVTTLHLYSKHLSMLMRLQIAVKDCLLICQSTISQPQLLVVNNNEHSA